MSKIKIAIFGASGYSGEELFRLLSKHPDADIKAVTSRQYAGQGIETVFPRLSDTDLKFCEPDVDTIAPQVDCAFLALPHGLAHQYAAPLLAKGLKVIDISADFRLKSLEKYKSYYKVDHPAPDLLPKAVYGLTEVYRDQIKGADLIACPGCYPTSILLPLIPFMKAGVLDTSTINIASMSGVSGAGRKLDLPYLFAECNESARPYAAVGHRHTPEVEQELSLAAGYELKISFTPHLIPITRGMHSTIFVKSKEALSSEQIDQILNDAYGSEAFVQLLGENKLADTKFVSMTNKCCIGYSYDRRQNQLILSSAIDNLTKGASGQAIQAMNIIFEKEETAGLK